MTIKLIQKSFLNGTREFELVDDVINVRIKKFFKEEKITVGLAIVNRDPVMNAPYLEFRDRYNGHILLSLLLNKPNTKEFTAFVDAIRQISSGERKSRTSNTAQTQTTPPKYTRSEVLDFNVYEEPPAFAEYDETEKKINFKPVNAQRVDDNITMLKTYMNEDDIKPLLDTLETLKVEPDNEVAFRKMVDTFNDMGSYQGAVLNYAPYLKVLLSECI